MRKNASDLTTRVSTKGQVILPKRVREKHGWRAGQELRVEERADGILLRAVDDRATTRIEDIAGCLAPARRIVSIEEMRDAVADVARRRWGHEYDDRD